MKTQTFVALLAVMALSVPAWGTTDTCYDSSGLCTLTGNDVTCNSNEENHEIHSCDSVTCYGDSSCEYSTIASSHDLACSGTDACVSAIISNVDSVECSTHACQGSSMSNVDNLVCSGGLACESAAISNIPLGAQIDCDARGENGNDSGSCRSATFESTNPFTLTCQSTRDASGWACESAHITNPGGSVFCYGGGSASSGSCSYVDIDDSFGCLICGDDFACDNVELIAIDQTVTEIGQQEVYVHPKCKHTDVVDYLNKLHPEDGTECEKNDDSEYCAVVEAYCANNPRDANCKDEFVLPTGGSWKKIVKPVRVRDVDPDSLNENDDEDDDSVSRESWIVGSVVIVVFLLMTIGVVVVVGRKKQWDCCAKKQVSVVEEKDVVQEHGGDKDTDASADGENVVEHHV